MNKKQSQSGFAHLAIIIVLVVVLLGTLGFVYWQNFMQPKTDTTETINSTITNTYKTYADEKYNYSFKYLDKWTLGPIRGGYPGDQYINRNMDVKNENGEVVATLIVGVDSLGGMCGGPDTTWPVRTVLDFEPSSIAAEKPVTFSFIVTPTKDSAGSYSASYGLTDKYTRLGVFEKDCLGYILFTANTIKDNLGSGRVISFGDYYTLSDENHNKRFDTIDDARKYIESNEYKEIKKMLLSFSF